MKSIVRTLTTAVLLGAAFAVGTSHAGLGGRSVLAQVPKDSPRVVIFDSNSNFSGTDNTDPQNGLWGFYPSHIEVYQGQQIEFDAPANNFFPHAVTSVSWTGGALARTIEVGTLFNSTTSFANAITAGTSWTLDTTSLAPGQYDYFCEIHPWMVGTISVVAAGS